MRIIINDEEFYFFKKIFYKTSVIYYYNNDSTTLADKYFSTSNFRLSNYTKEILNILTESSEAPDLISPPSVINVSIEDQFLELETFLANNFGIYIDDSRRFYAKISGYGGLFNFDAKLKTIYFSWQEIIQLYNSPHRYLERSIKSLYIKNKYKLTKDLNKKYVYLNLKRKKGGKFIVESERLVALPR